MDWHRAWQGAKDLTRSRVPENFTRGPVLEHPCVELRSLLVRHIHVILDSVQVRPHLRRVYNLVSLRGADIDDGKDGCVGRGNVGLETWSP